MVDKGADGASLRSAWRSLGQRVAVAGGAFVSFFALFHHVPVATAALRGALTWLVLLSATRLFGWLLASAMRLDEEAGVLAHREGTEETSAE